MDKSWKRRERFVRGKGVVIEPRKPLLPIKKCYWCGLILHDRARRCPTCGREVKSV